MDVYHVPYGTISEGGAEHRDVVLGERRGGGAGHLHTHAIILHKFMLRVTTNTTISATIDNGEQHQYSRGMRKTTSAVGYVHFQ